MLNITILKFNCRLDHTLAGILYKKLVGFVTKYHFQLTFVSQAEIMVQVPFLGEQTLRGNLHQQNIVH